MIELPEAARFLLRFHGYDPADVEEFKVHDKPDGQRVVRVRVRPKSVLIDINVAMEPGSSLRSDAGHMDPSPAETARKWVDTWCRMSRAEFERAANDL